MFKLRGSFYNPISLINKKSVVGESVSSQSIRQSQLQNVLRSGLELLICLLSSILGVARNPFSDEQVVVAKGHYAICCAKSCFRQNDKESVGYINMYRITYA